MDIAVVLSACFRCEQMFSFNPHKVPSIKDSNGVRQPLCRHCHSSINELRRSKGLEPWPEPLEGAYDPLPEEEL